MSEAMFLFNKKEPKRNKTPKSPLQGQEKELNEILMTQDRERITEMVLQMGEKTRDMLSRSISVVETGNEEDARAVLREDANVDRLEMEINWECFSAMAMRQPVQDDLRYVFAIVKLTTDLERVGDESTNIARHLLRYRPYLNDTRELGKVPVMLSLVIRQLEDVLTAIKNNDLLLARKVFVKDEEIDTLYEDLYDDFLNNAPNCPNREFSRKAYILALARHLERAGDHIANVAEYLCFMLTGERIASENDPSKDY